jgi:two-component system response regulator PilR (NtrC family)
LNKILIVEDEKSMRDLLGLMLRKEGYGVETAESADIASGKIVKSGEYDLVISDISMPGMSGLELLRHTRKVSPDTEVILMTAFGSKQTAIDALNDGALYYVEKPFDLDEMKAVVRKTLQQTLLVSENADLKLQNRDLRAELKGRYQFEGLIGGSEKMKAIYQLIRRVAATGSTVMVSGESGTGKELIARAIHYNSGRGEKGFVSINCGALPDELLESELFGHMKGSFTGATNHKQGLFEVASGGTIFLDEIGETSAAMQIKLLRVLQERRIRRVGGTEEIHVDARVITASNQDLGKLVREKRFREDLYYRINVIAIHMPTLRERPEDIPALAEHFLIKYRRVIGKAISRGIAKAAMERLEAYDWPGNVRQLENVVERAVALATGEEIGPESLPPEVRTGAPAIGEPDLPLPKEGLDVEMYLESTRRQYMLKAMERTGGVQTRAAELLGMTFRSFRYFAKKYHLGRDAEARENEPTEVERSPEVEVAGAE